MYPVFVKALWRGGRELPQHCLHLQNPMYLNHHQVETRFNSSQALSEFLVLKADLVRHKRLEAECIP